MKKFFLLINLIFLIQFIVGCDYIYILYRQDSRDISTIQLITIENEKKFSMENIKVLKEFSNDENKVIVLALESIYQYAGGKTGEVTDYPNGNGLLITYKDNKKTIITLMAYDEGLFVYSGELSSSGDILDNINLTSLMIVQDFETLLNTLMEDI